MPGQSFHELLRLRLSEVGLALPPGPAQKVYTLTFSEQAAMHFVDAGDGAVEVVAEAGTLRNLRSADTLLALLGCSPSAKPYAIALHCDKRTGALLLWTLMSLIQLDRKGFDAIVAAMLARIDAVRAALAGTAAPARQPVSTGHWMRLRQIDAKPSGLPEGIDASNRSPATPSNRKP
jgi:hypothetical protein